MKFECCRNCRHCSDGITVPENNPCSDCHSEYLDGVTGIRAIPTRWESVGRFVNKEGQDSKKDLLTTFSIDDYGRTIMELTEEYTAEISEHKEHILEEIIETTVNELNESVVKHTISFDREQACNAIRNAIPMKPTLLTENKRVMLFERYTIPMKQIVKSFRYECSTCKTVVHPWYNYCHKCGQKLDWKDIFDDEED